MKLLSSLNINRIVLVIGAAVVLLYLLAFPEQGLQPISNSSGQPTTKADFYLVNDVSSQFDQEGLLDVSVSNQRVDHNPANDSIDLTRPIIQLFADGKPQWHISADYGVLFEDEDRAELKQQVVIISDDQKTSLKTPELTLFPEQRRAQTDKPVTLASENGFTRAIGMKAELEKKYIALLTHVRGLYEPTAPSDNDE